MYTYVGQRLDFCFIILDMVRFDISCQLGLGRDSLV